MPCRAMPCQWAEFCWTSLKSHSLSNITFHAHKNNIATGNFPVYLKGMTMILQS